MNEDVRDFLQLFRIPRLLWSHPLIGWMLSLNAKSCSRASREFVSTLRAHVTYSRVP